MSQLLYDLVRLAGRAPSGDNTQPWRLRIDQARSAIAIELDASRDTSLMNAGNHMALIACGAALETLIQAAQAQGCSVELACAPGALMAVRIRPAALSRPDAEVDQASIDAILRRCTNRRRYDASSLERRHAQALEALLAPAAGVRGVLISERRRISELAEVLGECDGMLFEHQRMRTEILSAVHPRHGAAGRTSGMPLGTLEAAWRERLLLRLLRLPNPLPRLFGLTAGIVRHHRQLLASASALALVVAPEPVPELYVGRAMQRLWLGCARLQLQAQPAMAVVVLRQLALHAPDQLSAGLKRRSAQRWQRLLAALPELDGEVPAFLLRIGRAAEPSARTPRRPLAELLASADPTPVPGHQRLGTQLPAAPDLAAAIAVS